jgi:hypothetical protein
MPSLPIILLLLPIPPITITHPLTTQHQATIISLYTCHVMPSSSSSCWILPAPAPNMYYKAVATQQPPPQVIITPGTTPCEPIFVSVAAPPPALIWTFLTFWFDNNKKCAWVDNS